jgi:hypothetical protein
VRSPTPRTVRIAALLVCGLCLLGLASSYLTADPTVAATGPTISNASGPNGTVGVEAALDNGTASAAALRDAEHVTVVSTQGFYASDEEAELVAFTADGTVAYHDGTYRTYFDVDPVANTSWTVEYVAARHYQGEACAQFETDGCTRNVVERVNLSTGETERVWSRFTRRIPSGRYHDVDRVNDTHLVVADILGDGVFVVDTRTGEETWRWNANASYSRTSGGRGWDWTHANDVEVLEDGRIMLSLRNQDSVVFLRPGEGLVEGWTLGTDDDHATLYEQHNPDYLPREQGGPAVLVADSENGRVVEYQRENGTWTESWTWRDARLQWPRDADRLPNGHTLVVDTHGDRVLELDRNGTVVWNVSIGMAYDAERLGTGDESTGGPSMAALSGEIDRGPRLGPGERAIVAAKGVLPSLVVNGLLYAAPPWVRFTDLLIAGLLVLTLVGWGLVEFRWSRFSVRGALARLR